MALQPWECAHGEQPSIVLPCAATVVLAPSDDSVDSNSVTITGSGTINSFGPAPVVNLPEDDPTTTDPDADPIWLPTAIDITKKVTFLPNTGQTITLHHNPPIMNLLGHGDRAITAKAFGEYHCDANGNWQETQYFADSAIPSSGFVSSIVYTTSQTITIPGSRAKVRLVGGGGGGWYTPVPYAGASGAYLEKFLTGLVIGHTLALTIGAGGTAPGTGSTPGLASTLVSGTQAIATLTAGGGGAATFAGAPYVAQGGVATGG
ncbi:MAG TPA: hypothetical protein VKB76_17505, partial [Ktedonobacterales bacterium]|nr:hypothetical protein [Ktedonobacterales bacterium]